LSEQEKIAQRYARQLSAEHHVDAALYSEAEHAFGQRGLVEITYLIGIYHTVCGLLNAFEIPAPGLQAQRPSGGSVGGFGNSSLENDHAD
jgi:4-carboxymuconolactone decarboxylase